MEAKTLLPHQIEDSAFLARTLFAGNFSGMGSGKTLSSLDAIKKVVVFDTQRVIIVGPPISLQMWADEFEAYFPGSKPLIVKTGTQKLATTADALIMSYDIATKRVEELKRIRPAVLIFDESHALKTPEAKRTHALIRSGGLCESASFVAMLTGTPSTRWNDDLFTFLCRAAPDRLKAKIGKLEFERFRLRYCITQLKKFHPNQRKPKRVTVGNRNTDELNEMLFGGYAPPAIRHELADVWAEMPPITINRLMVTLSGSPEFAVALKELEKKSMRQIEEKLQNRDPALATIRRQLGEAKVRDSVAEIASRIDAGVKPLLIGAWHTNVIDALAAALREKKIDVRTLDGRTGAAPRRAIVADFNDARIDGVIGQISAMGVSLNLQGGSHIAVVEEDWSPSIMDQFYARCHRIGQANHVHVDIFGSDTKLDKAIRKISATKRREHATLMAQKEAS